MKTKVIITAIIAAASINSSVAQELLTDGKVWNYVQRTFASLLVILTDTRGVSLAHRSSHYEHSRAGSFVSQSVLTLM